ncbi:hypothetical protein [Paraglaciecola hydrolytica]|uniref:Extracellular endo-alpha-(1->5)-L-arabinanase C-terminal domain-containing protein n=1 Tax=Paraglaciecola hydrolytica TaxID=1799789 RepID=A0A135ZZK1_9ALTE|nr:hypothetical protein [Paraglaciecola hydrolytica]KXI28419.1 hypothetical protein AX660_15060 [Paraglaciecola hydrolytica]
MNFKPFLILVFGMLIASQSIAATALEGTWQLISGEYIDANGDTLSYASADMQSLKVLSTKHFSFTSMKGEQFWAAGTGTYEFKDGQYVESLLLNSFGEKVGATFAFQAQLDGDKWYNSRWKDGKRVEYEVWQKVN